MTRRILPVLLLLLACGIGVSVWFVLRDDGVAGGVSRDSGPGEPPPMAGAEAPLLGAPAARTPAEEPAMITTRAPVARVLSPACEVLVVDEGGAPIVGAEVVRLNERMFGAFGDEDEVRIDEDEDDRALITNAEGRCTLPAAESTGSLVTSGALHVRAPGFLHRKLKQSPTPPTTVVMSPAVRVSGRVLEAKTLLPVPGADVRPRASGCPVCPERARKADAFGQYSIEGFPLNQQVALRASAPRFIAAKTPFEVRDTSVTTLDLVLQPCAEVWLEFFDIDTHEVVGEVEVRGAKRRTSDAEGQLRSWDLVGIDLESSRLSISRSEYAPVELILEPEHLDLDQPVRIPMARVRRIEGRVSDRAGTPIEDARVIIKDVTEGDAQRDWRRAHADALDAAPGMLKYKRISGAQHKTGSDGEFELPGLTPWTREIEVWVRCEGFSSRRGRRYVTPGTGADWSEWILIPTPSETGTIRGRLVVNGEPTGGIVKWTGATRWGTTRAGEDGDGAFLIEGVELGSVTLVPAPWSLNNGDWCAEVTGTSTVEVRADATTTVELDVFVPLTTISGTVRWSTGEPVTGQWVEGHDDQYCGAPTALTDEQGFYSLQVPTRLGGWTVTARSSLEKHELDDLSPGATNVDFVFERSVSARVRVLDGSDGLPLKKVQLHWQRSGTSESVHPAKDLGLPDPDGWFQVELPAGLLDLVVSPKHTRKHAQHAVAQEVDAARTPDLEFTVRSGHSLDLELAKRVKPWPRDVEVFLLAGHERGAVVWDADRQRARDGDLSAGRAPRSSRRVRFSGGEATLEGLPPGRYEFICLPNTVSVTPRVVRVGPDTKRVSVRWSRR